MKVRILKNFIDKETQKFMAEGTELEYEVRRAIELKEKGFLEMLEPLAKEKPVVKETEKKETKTTKKRKTIAND